MRYTQTAALVVGAALAAAMPLLHPLAQPEPTSPVTTTETVTVEVPVPVEVKVPVEVPDPTAYQRGYEAATSELGGMVDPANIAAALDTPCEQEDSVNCYWRADIMGNGQGDSFVNIEGHQFPLASLLGGAS